MNIRPKTEQELDLMRQSGRILNQTHQKVAPFVTEGKSLQEIDHFVAATIRELDGEPAFLGYHDFPASSCLSLNDEVVHGIPSSYVLKPGDILGVDIGVRYQGYYTDAAVTIPIGPLTKEVQTLLQVTHEALKVGIEVALAGNTVGDIGLAIEMYVKSQGKYGIIRDLSGHGIGTDLQEPPEILNYATKNNTLLTNGMTIAIEPMLSLGDWRVTLDSDNWTIRTKDNSLAAHYETTIIIRDADPEILVPFPVDAPGKIW